MDLASEELKPRHSSVDKTETEHELESGDDSSDISDGDDMRAEFESAMNNNFDFIGDYAYGSALLHAPNPAMSLEGVGLIGLPLSARDAKVIIQSAEQAPFGQADRTLVNPDVRHTWEIQPNQVTFANPDWQAFITQTAHLVCEKLGAKVPVGALRCELYKMLLYEPGSHFLSHQDTVKTPGMFATVIVLLPSQYSGGEVNVSHSGKSKTFDFSASSLLTTSVLSWYTDVHHEVRTVTTGYRLALSYNLVQTAPGPPPHIPDSNAAVKDIRNFLKRWRDNKFASGEDFNFLAYILDHQYSAAGLAQGFNALKGKDMQKLAYLRPQAEELGFKLCLGNMSCHVSGEPDEDTCGYGGGYGRRSKYGRYYGYDSDEDEDEGETPEMGEELERSYRVENLVTLEGAKLLDPGKVFTLEGEQVVPLDAFDGIEPDDKSYEGYMGNYSGSVEHYYRRTVLIIMPEGTADSTLIGAGGVHYALNKLNESKQMPPTAENLNLANVIMQKVGSYETDILNEMYNNSILWGNVDLWKSVTSRYAQVSLPKLVEAGAVFGFEVVRDTYDTVLAKPLPLEQRLSFIDDVVASVSAKSPELVNQVESWRGNKLNGLADSIQNPSANDVPGLILFTERMGYGPFIEKVVPKLAKNASTTYPFWLAFAKALHAKKTPSSSNASLTDLDRLLDACINTVTPLWESVVAYPYYGGSHASKVERIIEILDLCITTKHMAQCKVVLASVLKSTGDIQSKFITLYTPIIARLPACLRKHNLDMLSPPFGELLQVFVGQYLHDVLGARPKTSKVNVRKIGCGCADCNALDSFLMSKATEVQYRLPMARKTHIEKRVMTAPDMVKYTIIRYGSPHSIRIVKNAEIAAAGQWGDKVQEAKRFLGQVGGEEILKKLMAHRYADIQKALDGSQQFMLPINRPTDSRTPTQGTEQVQGVKRKVM